jgi:formate hydrogenlyase subunit 4
MNQVLAPVTQMLKRNSTNLNTAMLALVILFLFPVKHFVPYDIKENVESELKKIMQVPWIMALVSIFILCIFYSGDVKMLALSLYIVHYLAIHQ